MGDGTELEPVRAIPDPIWRQILAEPERSLELIALAAADRFAGPAERWVQVAGVGHDGPSLAGLAYRKHVRLARVEGLTLGAGGLLTSAANLGGLAWVQARMVFYIAAAYGYETDHPMRPAELLALWDVYESAAAARESLDGMGTPMAQALVQNQLAKAGDRKLSGRLIKYVGKRAATKLGGRLIPLIGAPISAVQNGGSTKDLGRRTLEFYGGSHE